MAINQANGKGNTFQNLGLAGESPLPIFEASFGARGSQPALAAGSGWTSGTFINNLLFGQAGTLAATLQGRSAPTYYCRLVGSNFGPCADRGYTGATPYPINFWVPNPYVAQNDWTNDNSWGNYNSLQAELHQRLRSGVTFTGSYTWSHALTDMPTQSTASGNVLNYTTIRNLRLDKAPLSNDRRHAFRLYGTYDLPFGAGRMWAVPNPVLNRILGGWTLGSIATIVSGAPTFVGSAQRTINNFGDGGVLLGNGMTATDFRNLVLEDPRNNPTGGFSLLRADPSLLNPDGTANAKLFTRWITPGTLGQRFYLTGSWFWSFNTSVNKDIRIKERVRMTIQGEFLNVLNHPEFDLPNLSPTSATFGQVTSVMNGSPVNGPAAYLRTVQLRAYLRW
jgi:hypothetical protein